MMKATLCHLLNFIILKGILALEISTNLLKKHEDYQDFVGLSEVVTNLVTIDNTDPVIISDFDLQKQVIIFIFHTFIML